MSKIKQNNIIKKAEEKHYGKNKNIFSQPEQIESYCFNCTELSENCECGYVGKNCDNLDCNLKYNELLNKYENIKQVNDVNYINYLKELKDENTLILNTCYKKLKDEKSDLEKKFLELNKKVDLLEKSKIKYKQYALNFKHKLENIGIQYEDELDTFLSEYQKYNEYIKNRKDEIETKNVSNVSSIPDYFIIYLFSETEEEKENRINKEKEEKLKNFNKKILKSKFMTVCHHAFINKDNILKEKKQKEDKLRKKIELKRIKSKTRIILNELFDDSLPFFKLTEKIKKNKTIVFDNKNIHQSAVNIDRSMMTFLSNLYDEKENKKSLSNKDFMLAVNEFHTDKNSTRMNRLCKIIYYLSKSEVIWNSSLIFKHIYSFQYIQEYQIPHLIRYIENIIKS